MKWRLEGGKEIVLRNLYATSLLIYDPRLSKIPSGPFVQVVAIKLVIQKGNRSRRKTCLEPISTVPKGVHTSAPPRSEKIILHLAFLAATERVMLTQPPPALHTSCDAHAELPQADYFRMVDTL